jgi:hypothetical protein
MPAENLLSHRVMLPSFLYGCGRQIDFKPYITINIWLDILILGITSCTIEIIILHVYSEEKEIIRIPYSPPKDIFTVIKKIDVSYIECFVHGEKDANISNCKRIIAKIKKHIEDEIDKNPTSRQLQCLQKLNIVDEIQQLKKSVLPSKEITELQKTSSKLNSDTSQLTKLLHEEKEKTIQTELVVLKLLQEKEKHDSEMLSMKSSITQLQEDIKLLFRKTSELQYENISLTKLVEEEKIKTKSESLKESSGLSFTQANTIGQALMKEDIFNCM